ncbi:unnamed protein product, partial [Effrenium voratum]
KKLVPVLGDMTSFMASPGKYLVHRDFHFQGVSVYREGAVLHTSHRVHEQVSLSFQAAARFTRVFKVCEVAENAAGSCLEDDCRTVFGGCDEPEATLAEAAAFSPPSPAVGDRVMVLQPFWLECVLNGSKTLELRGRPARLGFVWLGLHGSVRGSAAIATCKKICEEEFQALSSSHQMIAEHMPYAVTWALGLGNVRELETPIPYFRLRGAIGWNVFRLQPEDAPPKRRRVEQGLHKRPAMAAAAETLPDDSALSFGTYSKKLALLQQADKMAYKVRSSRNWPRPGYLQKEMSTTGLACLKALSSELHAEWSQKPRNEPLICAKLQSMPASSVKTLAMAHLTLSEAEIKSMWQANSSEAAKLGTHMHLLFEVFLNRGIVPLQSMEFRMLLKFLSTLGHLRAYRTEWPIFAERELLAGTIDFVAIGADGKLALFDWKRTQALRTKFSNRFGKMESPLDTLDDCAGNHYRLQLNIYKYILETYYGLQVASMYIVSCHPDNWPEAFVDKVPNLGSHVQEIMQKQRQKNHSLAMTVPVIASEGSVNCTSDIAGGRLLELPCEVLKLILVHAWGALRAVETSYSQLHLLHQLHERLTFGWPSRSFGQRSSPHGALWSEAMCDGCLLVSQMQ